MSLVQPDIPRIHQALNDAKHDVCAVVVLSGDVYADVIADAATGEVIAWDGWYADPSDGSAEVTPLADVDWDDWDDMPTKLLIRSTSKWAGDRMAFWLIPTFSPAREAARMVLSHADMDTTSDAARNMRNGRVVAYLPITDRDVYGAELSKG